jgi:hypothetical protein
MPNTIRLRIKPDVSIRRLQPQAVLAVTICAPIWAEHGAELVITSGDDGAHKVGSLHYEGLAVDLRWPETLPVELREQLAVRVRVALGPHYDVIPEPTHLHIEYDPKNKPPLTGKPKKAPA